MESKLITQKGTCYICGCNEGYERHHCIHGAANRKLAEKERLWVWLCRECHRRLHDKNENDDWLMAQGQKAWEKDYIKNYPYKNHAEQSAIEEFVRIFGKNYIYEESN
jgi:hypothetical protein